MILEKSKLSDKKLLQQKKKECLNKSYLKYSLVQKVLIKISDFKKLKKISVCLIFKQLKS